MAFDKVSTVLGSDVSYQLSNQAKTYAFKDLGFSESKQGNLQYNRPLDMMANSKGPRLKITVAKDLKTFKMSITTANGMRQLNIFENDDQLELQQNFQFIMNEMINRHCFEVVS